jgi:hypothetical protein
MTIIFADRLAARSSQQIFFANKGRRFKAKILPLSQFDDIAVVGRVVAQALHSKSRNIALCGLPELGW